MKKVMIALALALTAALTGCKGDPSYESYVGLGPFMVGQRLSDCEPRAYSELMAKPAGSYDDKGIYVARYNSPIYGEITVKATPKKHRICQVSYHADGASSHERLLSEYLDEYPYMDIRVRSDTSAGFVYTYTSIYDSISGDYVTIQFSKYNEPMPFDLSQTNVYIGNRKYSDYMTRKQILKK